MAFALDLSSNVGSLTNSLIANRMYKEYAKMLEQMTRQVPGAVKQAEDILKSQANIGDPNYLTAKENIDELLPTTLNQLRDVLSGSGYSDIISSLFSQTLGKQRQLDIQQTAALQAGQNRLAGFYSNVKAPYQQVIADYNDKLKMAAKQSRLQGKSAILQTASDLMAENSMSGVIGDILSSGGGSTDYSSMLSSAFAGDTSGDVNKNILPSNNDHMNTNSAQEEGIVNLILGELTGSGGESSSGLLASLIALLV